MTASTKGRPWNRVVWAILALSAGLAAALVAMLSTATSAKTIEQYVRQLTKHLTQMQQEEEDIVGQITFTWCYLDDSGEILPATYTSTRGEDETAEQWATRTAEELAAQKLLFPPVSKPDGG